MLQVVPIIAVYSKYMPKKSEGVRQFLKRAGVEPAEITYLENYHPPESPEDVGFFINGQFIRSSDLKQIWNCLQCLKKQWVQKPSGTGQKQH